MKNNKQGFTLIELLVVIAIIGILATSAVTVFSGGQLKARDAKRISDVQNIAGAMALYQADNDGSYPTTAALLEKYLSKTPVPPNQDTTVAQQPVYVIKINGGANSFIAVACGMASGTAEIRSAGDIAQTTNVDCTGANIDAVIPDGEFTTIGTNTEFSYGTFS
jgi:prepilin-type N-terminal cleavage/methylation domain-containing protein